MDDCNTDKEKSIPFRSPSIWIDLINDFPDLTLSLNFVSNSFFHLSFSLLWQMESENYFVSKTGKIIKGSLHLPSTCLDRQLKQMFFCQRERVSWSKSDFCFSDKSGIVKWISHETKHEVWREKRERVDVLLLHTWEFRYFRNFWWKNYQNKKQTRKKRKTWIIPLRHNSYMSDFGIHLLQLFSAVPSIIEKWYKTGKTNERD